MNIEDAEIHLQERLEQMVHKYAKNFPKWNMKDLASLSVVLKELRILRARVDNITRRPDVLDS